MFTASLKGCFFRCRVAVVASVGDRAQVTSPTRQESTRHTAAFILPGKTLAFAFDG